MANQSLFTTSVLLQKVLESAKIVSSGELLVPIK